MQGHRGLSCSGSHPSSVLGESQWPGPEHATFTWQASCTPVATRHLWVARRACRVGQVQWESTGAASGTAALAGGPVAAMEQVPLWVAF